MLGATVGVHIVGPLPQCHERQTELAALSGSEWTVVRAARFPGETGLSGRIRFPAEIGLVHLRCRERHAGLGKEVALKQTAAETQQCVPFRRLLHAFGDDEHTELRAELHE